MAVSDNVITTQLGLAAFSNLPRARPQLNAHRRTFGFQMGKSLCELRWIKQGLAVSFAPDLLHELLNGLCFISFFFLPDLCVSLGV